MISGVPNIGGAPFPTTENKPRQNHYIRKYASVILHFRSEFGSGKPVGSIWSITMEHH